MNEYGYVSIKLYLQKKIRLAAAWIWTTGHSLLIPDIFMIFSHIKLLPLPEQPVFHSYQKGWEGFENSSCLF